MTAEELRAPRALERVGFLLARHGQDTNSRMRQALSATGLSPRQALTLLHLAEGSTSQQALIEALGVDPSVLVAILNDLERDHLVERRRDPADRRRHIVELTAAGADALSPVEGAIAAVESELFAGLDAAEVAQLQGLLSRVRTVPTEVDCDED